MIYASDWVRVPVGTRVRDSKLDIYVINMGCVVDGERGRMALGERRRRDWHDTKLCH